MNRLHSLIDFLQLHKCWVVVIVTFLFVGFLDSDSLWERHYLWSSIKTLKNEISVLENNYNQDTQKLNELRNNPRQVERIAREKYLMTRPDEDLFIIESDLTQSEGVVVDSSTDDDEPVV